MVIECPPDVGPGDTLTVETEDGTEVDIEVPPGISPGQEFEVDLDARLAELKAKAEADAKAKAEADEKARQASGHYLERTVVTYEREHIKAVMKNMKASTKDKGQK